MKKEDLKQIMMTCIATLEKLSGRKASLEELYRALGKEYSVILSEYFKDNRLAAA